MAQLEPQQETPDHSAASKIRVSLELPCNIPNNDPNYVIFRIMTQTSPKHNVWYLRVSNLLIWFMFCQFFNEIIMYCHFLIELSNINGQPIFDQISIGISFLIKNK